MEFWGEGFLFLFFLGEVNVKRLDDDEGYDKPHHTYIHY